MSRGPDPFEQGKEAAIQGLDVDANPYPIVSSEFESWKAGFAFADTFDEDGEIPSDP